MFKDTKGTNFVVGDKVKVIHNGNGSDIVKAAMNKIGMITIIKTDAEMIYVDFGEEVWGDISIIGFFKGEIEKVNTEGQLLFSFMEQS